MWLKVCMCRAQFIQKSSNPVPIHSTLKHTNTKRSPFPKPSLFSSTANLRGFAVVERFRGGSALRKVLSGGQPKGKILRQESEKGERGWNHVSFISPGEKESINSFNPVFLQIRSALFGTSVAQLSCASGYNASLWDTETGGRKQMIISLKEAVMI